MNTILNRINRKLLDISLSFIKKHISKQDNLFVYTYKRDTEELIPITWSARGITNSHSDKKSPTNDWITIDKFINYDNKVVVDIGASLGATSVPFSKKAKIVYALEPQLDNYYFLQDQITIRKINNIKTFNVAASDFNGKSEFFNRESHGVHSLGVHNKGKIVSSSEVEVTTLDDFWKKEINEQIGLLKIDVEGFEVDVFNGASYLLNNKLIDFIIFEFSPRIHKLRNIDIDAPISTLLKHNYNLFTVDGKDFKFDKDNIPKICDLIAMPSKRV